MTVEQQLRESAARARAALEGLEVRDGAALIRSRRRRGRVAAAVLIVAFVAVGSTVALPRDDTRVDTIDEAPDEERGFPSGQGPSVVLDRDGNELFSTDQPPTGVSALLFGQLVETPWLQQLLADGTPESSEALHAALNDAGLRIETAIDRGLTSRLAAAMDAHVPVGLDGYAIAVDLDQGAIAAAYGPNVTVREAPGSAFHPIAAAAALDDGFDPATPLVGGPTLVVGDGDESFTVSNFGGEGGLSITLDEALVTSRNTAIVDLQNHGLTPEEMVQTCRRLTIDSELPPALSLPLGPAPVTPLELARAYSAFALDGVVARTDLALSAADPNDESSEGSAELERGPIDRERSVSSSTANTIAGALGAVVERGTATKAAIPGKDVRGKTGATQRGARWFVGWTGQTLLVILITDLDAPTDSILPSSQALFDAPLLVFRDAMSEAG